MKREHTRKFLFLISLFITTQAFSQKTKFEFIYTYDGNGKDTYISEENLFIRDEVRYGKQKVKIKLDKKERLRILDKIKELDLLNYPENYSAPDAESGSIVPCDNASLKLFIDSKEKIVFWDNCTFPMNVKSENVKKLLNMIYNIISNKRDFKRIKLHSEIRM